MGAYLVGRASPSSTRIWQGRGHATHSAPRDPPYMPRRIPHDPRTALRTPIASKLVVRAPVNAARRDPPDHVIHPTREKGKKKGGRAICTFCALVVVVHGDAPPPALARDRERGRASVFSRLGRRRETPRQPSQKHDQSSILRTTTHSGVMVVTGAPRGTLLVRFGALFVFRASARARDESTCLALACERTTTISVVAIGDPESPGLRLPGKPPPAPKGSLPRRARVRESGVIPGG